MVLLFSVLKKAQIYKMPYRDSAHHEIEILMSFDYLHLFRPNEHSEDYHIRKPNDEYFLFKIEEKNYIHVGGNLFSFETNDEIIKLLQNMILKFHLLTVKKTSTSCYIKNIFLFKNMKIRQ